MSIAGIDVSHHNGPVDWRAAADSISFAFVKATQGARYVDPKFAQNWKAMKAASIPRGAYHFFDPKKDGLLQAQLFLSQVTLEPDDLPPVLDLEVLTGVTVPTAVARIEQWLAAVRTATRRNPIVYTTASFWQLLGNPEKTGDYPLWVAHYGVPAPRLPKAWDSWDFWQFSQLGRCNGIAGYVDLNRFSGTVAELQNVGRFLPQDLLRAA